MINLQIMINSLERGKKAMLQDLRNTDDFGEVQFFTRELYETTIKLEVLFELQEHNTKQRFIDLPEPKQWKQQLKY